jgi:hypothetical protein
MNEEAMARVWLQRHKKMLIKNRATKGQLNVLT